MMSVAQLVEDSLLEAKQAQTNGPRGEWKSEMKTKLKFNARPTGRENDVLETHTINLPKRPSSNRKENS